MSKKNLLNEATVRRFMQLADLKPLTEDILPETEEVVEGMHDPAKHDEDHEEEVKEGMHDPAKHDEDHEEKEDLEEAHCGKRDGEEEDLEEMAHPAKHDEDHKEAEELAPEADMVSLEDLKKGLEALVAAVPGLDLEVEGEEEAPAEEAPEMELDMEVEEEPAEELEDEDPAGRDHYMEESETLAEEITRKVMERIAQEQNKQEIDVDVLAERIMKRLSEKKK